MNQRTKALWLPALASLAAASLFTLALTEISLQPHIIARLNSTVAPLLYVVWLFSNLFLGPWAHSYRGVPADRGSPASLPAHFLRL